MNCSDLNVHSFFRKNTTNHIQTRHLRRKFYLSQNGVNLMKSLLKIIIDIKVLFKINNFVMYSKFSKRVIILESNMFLRTENTSKSVSGTYVSPIVSIFKYYY